MTTYLVPASFLPEHLVLVRPLRLLHKIRRFQLQEKKTEISYLPIQ